MRKYEKKKRTSEYMMCTDAVCAFCGKKAGRPDDETNMWGCDNFGISEVQISCSTGSRFPEGGSKETVFLDCCPSCFESVVMPTLTKLTLPDEAFQHKDTDW